MGHRGDHGDLSLAEAADRLAIRELVDAYAYCADRRDVAGQLALFTEDTELVVFADSRDPTPTQRFRGRAALAPVFDELYLDRLDFGFIVDRELLPDVWDLADMHVDEIGRLFAASGAEWAEPPQPADPRRGPVERVAGADPTGSWLGGVVQVRPQPHNSRWSRVQL